jgi:hypothetical protein
MKAHLGGNDRGAALGYEAEAWVRHTHMYTHVWRVLSWRFWDPQSGAVCCLAPGNFEARATHTSLPHESRLLVMHMDPILGCASAY